ncbi:hypothetical protein PV327_003553 [Microctonus hyperodae]|uniref:3-dehydrosphinganine reductase n=1 Tax=Microctonus hyperodae TaxID=165561 RepID=A0AA39L163_MICHY|nr:hypothetical protein PV327_003553 [Microctonus hyperodae]
MAVVFGIILIVFVLVIVALLVKHFFFRQPLKNVEGKHVVVTGGSSGIGKSVAVLAAKNGAHVTIIARNIQNLEKARDEIINACKNRDVQKVSYLSMNLADNYESVERALLDVEKSVGPIYMLVNCAGTAICSKIEDTTTENLKWMTNLNFIGTYHCIKAVVPRMKNANDGIIVITSSLGALSGIFGLSAYCSTKFALRGLAESLAMELNIHNISVTLSMPPDTDTPGFAIEELSKPLETKLISGSAGLVHPDVVAKQLFEDALAGRFYSTVGFESFILSNLCAGFSPFSSFSELILQSILMGPLRLVGAAYLASFQRIIRNTMKTRNENKKSE